MLHAVIVMVAATFPWGEQPTTGRIEAKERSAVELRTLPLFVGWEEAAGVLWPGSGRGGLA